MHSKSRKSYDILYEAKDSETLDDVVVYRANYGDRKVWVRPKSMFYSNVELNGKTVPRFEKMYTDLTYTTVFGIVLSSLSLLNLIINYVDFRDSFLFIAIFTISVILTISTLFD